MLYLDLTLPTPEENLACDEALLEMCEAGEAGEVLRFWEPEQYFVVIGYANSAKTEVNLGYCREHKIAVLRRCSGGGTVLQGPGCLNYTLVLRAQEAGPLAGIRGTNEFILQKHCQVVGSLLQAPIAQRGHTDLAVGGLKFSGNAQRRRKHFILFHGTFLLDFDIGLVEKALPLPSKQPEYRGNRSHADFLVNLKLPADRLKSALRKVWRAVEEMKQFPRVEIEALTRDRYRLDEWNFRL
jgi:lipoate-protein ligase A